MHLHHLAVPTIGLCTTGFPPNAAATTVTMATDLTVSATTFAMESAAVKAVGAAQSTNVEIVIIDSSTGTAPELQDHGIWVWKDIETDDAETADLNVQVRVVEKE